MEHFIPIAAATTEGGTDPHAALLTTLFVMFVAAKIFAEIFERLRQPAVVGEILAGVLIGPSVLNLVQSSETVVALAEIGVILLMFTVGLETEPRAILSVGKTAVGVAILGILLPFVLGAAAIYMLAPWMGQTTSMVTAVFVGAAMVATSVGITARVLADMNVLNHQSSRIILAAAVIDDILALLILAAVSGMASTGGINWLHIGSTAVMAIAFVAFMALVGTRIMGMAAPRIERLRLRDPLFIVAIGLCLGLALLSYKIGMAAIIGAFLAGMVLADRSDQSHLLHKSETLVNLMLPFFLVYIGMQVDLQAFTSVPVIVTALVITVLAVIGKYFGGVLAARRLGKRIASQIGMGMVPRGEVGIVAAQIGLSLGALNQSTFAIVLFMAVATTLIAPPFLRRLYAGEPALPNGPMTLVPVVEQRPFRVE